MPFICLTFFSGRRLGGVGDLTGDMEQWDTSWVGDICKYGQATFGLQGLISDYIDDPILPTHDFATFFTRFCHDIGFNQI